MNSLSGLMVKDEPNISQGCGRSSVKNESGFLETAEKENDPNEDFMGRSTAMQTTSSRKIVTDKSRKYLMLKPKTRFKESRISATNSEGEFNPTFKTPSELSKASPHGRRKSQ